MVVTRPDKEKKERNKRERENEGEKTGMTSCFKFAGGVLGRVHSPV